MTPAAYHTAAGPMEMPADSFAEEVTSRLRTTWLARPLLFEEEVDSTNSQTAQLARDGGNHGTVLVADTQSNGRGRLNRSWHSPAGTNLYFSVLLRPGWRLGEMPPLSLAAGVALAEMAEEFLPAAPQLKWPNDLMYGGRKLAGILVEAAADRGSVGHVVLGVGLNVNQHDFPAPLDESASSLRMAAGRPLDRAEVLSAVLWRLEKWVDRLARDGAEPIIDGWRRFWNGQGKEIRVIDGGRQLTGAAIGLDARGALVLRDDKGREHAVVCGDATTTRRSV